ncbi:MAG: hypothetical protein HKM93_05815 [Desulfobacteraceae bacterium]|nr:hypothetical protein [Desulfobacteraceae bacterium]
MGPTDNTGQTIPESEDDDIIELTEKIDPNLTEREDIIDLTEKIDGPEDSEVPIIDLEHETEDLNNDEEFDLTAPITPDEEVSEKTEAGDTVIDLTEVAAANNQADDATTTVADMDELEPAIDLTEKVDGPGDSEVSSIDPEQGPETQNLNNDGEFDLTAPITPEEDVAEETETVDKVIDFTEVAPADNQADDAATAVADMDELEAAIERVIDRKFKGKIEALLYETIETAVSREIRKLRTGLMEESSDE